MKFNLQYLLLIILFVSTHGNAQITTAKIEGTIPTEGFYQIVVNPKIRAVTAEDFSNFRIYDSQNKEVPYVVKEFSNSLVYNKFTDLKILSKVIENKKLSSYIIENQRQELNSLSLIVANSAIEKKYNISGSNDQKEWFGIAMNQQFAALNTSESNSLRTIQFPVCNYKFIKLEFDNTKSLPINILNIGYNQDFLTAEKFLEIPTKSVQIKQILSQKITQIALDFDSEQIIDRINFAIKNPKFYNRQAKIFSIKTENGKDVKALIQTINLASDSKNEIEVSVSKNKKIIIEVDNQDNPELEIKSITCFQKPVFVSAWLKPNEKYTIKTNLPNSQMPNYDLSFFESEIEKNQVLGLEMNDIQTINAPKEVIPTESFWQKSWFMWLCISIAGLTILYFVNGLLKDMKQ